MGTCGRIAGIAVCVSALLPGCAFLASANRAHVHQGCVEDPTFAYFDLGVGTAAAGIMVATETKPAWLIVPGIFLVSGIVGSITARSCRGERRGAVRGPTVPPPLPKPIYEDEVPAVPGEPPPPPLPATQNPFRLPEDYVLEAPPEAEQRPCTIGVPDACPADEVCFTLNGGNDGVCKPAKR